MKTLRELYEEAVKLYGKETIDKMRRDFYKRIINVTDIICEILDDLNRKTGSRYSYKTKTTRQVISARINEGHTKEDFIKVNEIMAKKWMGTEMQKYLRPITLYAATKFEGYLAEYEREEQARKEREAQKKREEIEQKAKEGKAIRTNLLSWDSFFTYQELWSYIATMNTKEFASYPLPEELRKLQGEYLRLKLSKKAEEAEEMYQEIKRLK